MNRFLVTFILACISVSLQAATLQNKKVVNKTGFYQPDFLLEYAVGADTSHYEFGFDFQDETTKLGFAGLYISHDTYHLVGKDDDATMTGIGIRGLQFSSQEDELVGIDLHMGINRTEAADYSRTGIEIAMSFYENVSTNTSLILGGAFRPEFLSLDWSTDVVNEFGFEFGINYNIKQRVNLFAKYYSESLWDDDFNSTLIDDGVQFGITCIL